MNASNSPDHWFNCVGLDGRPYGGLEMMFFFVGCALWVVAYGIMMVRAWRDKFFEMAAFAGACNFGWEIVWGLFQTTDMGRALQLCYQAWLVLDCVLFAMLLAWGHKQVATPWIRQYFKPLLIGAAVFWACFFQFFALQGLDTSIGANSAYLCQVVLSACCLLLLRSLPTAAGFSWAAGIARCVGTGLVSVFMWMHYPDLLLLVFLAGVCTVLDSLYLGLLWTRWRKGEMKGTPGYVL